MSAKDGIRAFWKQKIAEDDFVPNNWLEGAWCGCQPLGESLADALIALGVDISDALTKSIRLTPGSSVSCAQLPIWKFCMGRHAKSGRGLLSCMLLLLMLLHFVVMYFFALFGLLVAMLLSPSSDVHLADLDQIHFG
jgi:hypothetical protein